MALIKSVRGFTPKVGKDCFLADNATLIGDTVIGDECSIWFGAILRGDVNSIRIGNRVNIQDGSVLHTLYEKSTIEIGDDVSIGQRYHTRSDHTRRSPRRHGLGNSRPCRRRRRSHRRRRIGRVEQDSHQTG